MHSALTQWGVSLAPVILATLEMGSTAQVSYSFISIQNIFGMIKTFRLIDSYMYTYLLGFIEPADINECELEIHSCSAYANCTDTDGSFNCTCREGFEGDGFNCTGMYNKRFT